MDPPFKKTVYEYRITPSTDDAKRIEDILSHASDIFVTLEGVELHFDYFSHMKDGECQGVIQPSLTTGSAFGYESSHHKPKSYDTISFLEFCELYAASIIVTSSFALGGSPHSPHSHIEIIGEKFYYDYSKMITLLQERGIVKVKKSKSFLTTDGRLFSLVSTHSSVKDMIKRNSDLKDHIRVWYEVDCLGTSLHQTLTSLIETLACA